MIKHKKSIFFGLGAVILITTILLMVLKSPGIELIGLADTVNGLKKSTEIRYRGVEVGHVSKVVPHPDHVSVHLRLKKKVQIPKGSDGSVLKDSETGKKYIQINPHLKTQKMLKDGDTLPIKGLKKRFALSEEKTNALVEFVLDLFFKEVDKLKEE